jgi:hypothetical protein
MSALCYARGIRDGLTLADKARAEAAFWLPAVFRALDRGDFGQVRIVEQALQYWLHEVDKNNLLALELCRLSRMPMTAEPSTLPPPPEAP